ncbi:Uncharacterised protein [uncultured archaeon]|nr:Uncharacterised protein [uncultured archaeon]
MPFAFKVFSATLIILSISWSLHLYSFDGISFLIAMVSNAKAAKLKRLLSEIKGAKMDPSFIEAAREFYKYHTGKELEIKATA